MFGNFFKKRALKEQAYTLYSQLVEQARQPAFYTDYGITDSIEGRFDAILLHLFLVDYWLGKKGDTYKDLRRLIQEAMVSDMDRSFREMGVGDMSVGKEMKKVGAAWLGRRKVYAEAVEDEAEAGALEITLQKNIFAEEAEFDAKKLADYTRAAIKALLLQEIEDTRKIVPKFPDPAKM